MLFDYYTRVKVEPSNLWVYMMYSIVEFKMRVLEELLRVLSPNRRTFVTIVLLEFSINTFDFAHEGQSFICVGMTVE